MQIGDTASFAGKQHVHLFVIMERVPFVPSTKKKKPNYEKKTVFSLFISCYLNLLYFVFQTYMYGNTMEPLEVYWLLYYRTIFIQLLQAGIIMH